MRKRDLNPALDDNVDIAAKAKTPSGFADGGLDLVDAPFGLAELRAWIPAFAGMTIFLVVERIMNTR